jgi:SAM-dependent methyltransferase
MSSISQSVSNWSSGVKAEANFWKLWASTKGHIWPQEFERRLDPDAVLDHTVGTRITKDGTVLDVGSGPLTSLGKVYGDKSFKVFACDPLAHLYDDILNENAINPLVRTEFAVAEDLSCFFPEEGFDVVHCQNALDHSFDPIRGIEEMLMVTKIGGHVILRHHINEAEHENYSGFHQYNFDEQDDDFVIWNKNAKILVRDTLPIGASLTHVRNGETIEVVISKGTSTKQDVRSDRDRARIRDLHEGVVAFYTTPFMSSE